MKRHHLSETTSLMALFEAPPWKDEEEDFLLLTTDYQTAGRGQRGNHWESERGKNLLFSFRLRPGFLPASEQFFLSEAVALSLCTTLREWRSDVCIKWPNDIYCCDRKLGGMLLEHRLLGAHIDSTIIGIGVNIDQAHFVSDAPNPISLCHLVQPTPPREAVLARFLHHFEHYYERLMQGQHAALHLDYRSALYRQKGVHTYADATETFTAQLTDILPNGTLLLTDTEGRLRRYHFKEVAFLLPPPPALFPVPLPLSP